ncbi:MAG: Mrp/NBP35 family ATP-binding protein [candidate division KSB1 bacterium]|nr:Mrp/NBP35 family ATP-binding protein [candidate division KSB1 bacterium]
MEEKLEQRIREAVGRIVDPEIGKTLGELNMIRGITSKDGAVHIRIALTVRGCPLASRFEDEVKRAVTSVVGNGVPVSVEFLEMSAAERESLAQELRRERSLSAQETPSGIAQELNRIDHVIAVMSGKGGVGKSVTTALLAVGLRRKGYRVGILDADITGSSIPRLFGVTRHPQTGFGAVIPIRTRTGLYVMGLNLLLENEDQPVVWRGPLIAGAIKQFWQDVLWGELDYLLIDLPPGTSDAPLTVLQQLPTNGVLLVTTPQDLAAMIVRKAVRMVELLEKPILGIIENMSYFLCPQCGTRHELFGPSQAFKVATMADVPIVARLPIDPQLPLLCDAGRIEEYSSPEADRMAAVITELVHERVHAKEP